MSNSAEWMDDKWAEVDLWLCDQRFVDWIWGTDLPTNEVDKLMALIRLHNEYLRETHETKNH